MGKGCRLWEGLVRVFISGEMCRLREDSVHTPDIQACHWKPVIVTTDVTIDLLNSIERRIARATSIAEGISMLDAGSCL